jgi:hypothetical protein
MGCVAPDFAIGGSTWGAFVLGAFPARICNASHCICNASHCSLTFAWGPLDQNVREDYLSHESEPPPLLSRLQSVGGVVRLPRLAVGPLTLSIGSQQLTIVSPSERPLRGDSAPGPSIPEPNGWTPFHPLGGREKLGGSPDYPSLPHRWHWMLPSRTFRRAERRQRSSALRRHGRHGGHRFCTAQAGPGTSPVSSHWGALARSLLSRPGIAGCLETDP